MKPNRVVLLAAGAVMALASLSAAQAQTYPTKTVRFVLGFGTGGVADIVARVVAPKLSEGLGQQVIVDNKPSAGGIIAAETVARSDPDGHTLLLISGGNAVSSSLFNALSYDPINDFAMVSTLGSFDLVLLVSPKSPVKTLKELIAMAKEKPGSLNIGTIGTGSTQHLTGELFRSLSGANIAAVQYRATPALMSALREGEVQIATEILAPVVDQVKSGAVHALAVTSTKRSQILPDTPTSTEAGLPGFEAASWNGIAVPAKTPKAIVDRLNREVRNALNDAATRQKLLDLGIEPRASTPEELRTFFVSESQKWGRVIAAAGIPKQ
jgi:tripartite-type tricarboxylate transporter receptor subunit TctC